MKFSVGKNWLLYLLFFICIVGLLCAENFLLPPSLYIFDGMCLLSLFALVFIMIKESEEND